VKGLVDFVAEFETRQVHFRSLTDGIVMPNIEQNFMPVCSGSLIGKGTLLPQAQRCFRQKRTVEIIWQLDGELAKDFAGEVSNENQLLQEVIKEVVGIHVLLTRSLFGGGILRRSLPSVSLAKLTSAPLRF
jgi:hypothetical protein